MNGGSLSSSSPNDGFRVARNDPSFSTANRSMPPVWVAATKDIPPRADGTIDLLSLITPSRDKIVGDWLKLKDELVVASAPFARIEVPIFPPTEYDLEVVATRTEGEQDLMVGMIYQGRSVGVVIDGWAGTEAGLSVDNGPGGGIARVPGALITNGKRFRLTCRVRNDELTVLADDNEVLRYEGKPTWNTIIRQWGARDNGYLVLGAGNSAFRIHQFALRPITGNARERYILQRPSAAAFAADGSIYLDDYPELTFKLGYGELGKHGATGFPQIVTEETFDPAEVFVEEKKYSHALAVHPPAEVTYEIEGRFRTLTLAAAIMDQTKPKPFAGRLTFKVVGDDKELWSAELTKHGEQRPATIDVTKVRRLKLLVEPHESIQWGWSVWLEPKLIP